MFWYRCKLCDIARIEEKPKKANFQTIENLFGHIMMKSDQYHEDFKRKHNLSMTDREESLERFREFIQSGEGKPFWIRGR